jgi:hypothetical protein
MSVARVKTWNTVLLAAGAPQESNKDPQAGTGRPAGSLPTPNGLGTRLQGV